MATQKKSVHSVGNINSSDIRTIPEVFAGADLENYSLVELAYVGDKRTASYLNSGSVAYLLCAVEVMYDNELFTEFYVGAGEGGRVIHLDKGVRFETTNFAQISGTAPARGQYAEWDKTAKKFKLLAAPSGTAPAGAVFKVVNVGTSAYGFGAPMVRFEVQ
ncbi:hypothetical protein ABEY43_06500 [Priestia megaterium]